MDYFNEISAIATAVGVILVFVQLILNSKIERTKFENDIVIRFIAITNDISFEIMYLRPDTDNFKELIEKKLQGFYKYFDLSNQELFLMNTGRISRKTRKEWRSGIIDLLKLKPFQYAWEIIKINIPENTFTQLRILIDENKEDLNI